MRQYSLLDRLFIEIDQSLRTVHGRPQVTERSNPADGITDTGELDEHERDRAARFMRINHAGEVSAQGLYSGQAVTAHSAEVREQMHRSALEENDHLAWCESRLRELGSHKSYLSPFWYWGSFSIGAFAGAIGDKWSLGFVTETERQVVRHLDSHLEQLSPQDAKTRAILEQMKTDELHHAHKALDLGGVDQLPWPIRKIIMPLMSKVMTRSAHWI